ncbi:hypothetical protein [Streptomyces sp. SDr-06]|uniref:hypothetical protein n=1 Tax=Streptomyces sp. SDr-06 TaxID=2267702 RepID=UPI0011C0671C|nr:hypothetical protein [Streptomyces sp. SDr-06]
MPDATLQIGSLQGIWRPVYARRLALHATADAIVSAAWRADLHGLNLGPAVDAWRLAIGEALTPAERHRRQAAAQAVAATLAARSWRRTRAALALAAQRAHRAGWTAGHALVTRDEADDSDLDEPENPYAIGSPDLSDDRADATATAVLSSALTAGATRAGRSMADSDEDPAGDAEVTLDEGLDVELAADVTVSAAYGAGMLAAYLGAGAQAVVWMTAGDARVCELCLSRETASPYSLLGAPTLPAHARCRCCLVPL